MPIDPARLDAMLAGESGERARAAAAGATVPPATMGRALTLAQQTGAPPLAVADALPDFEAQAHRDDVAAAASTSPAFARWHADPVHAAVAQGEASKLGLLSSTLETFNNLRGGYIKPLADAIGRGLARARLGASFQQSDASMLASTGQVVSEALDTPRQALEGVLRPLGLDYGDPLGTHAAVDATTFAAKEASADLQQTMTAVGARPKARDLLTNPLGALEQGVAYYGTRQAASAPALAFLLGTRDPHAAALLMGAPQGAQTYTDLRAQGVDARTAAAAGLGTGAAEVLGEELGLEGLLSRPLRNAATRGLAVEAGQEAATQAAQDEIEAQATGKPLTLSERLGNVFDAGALGVTTGGAISGARAAFGLADLAGSAHGAQQVERVVQQVQDTGAAKHAPQALAALAKEAAPDANVYLSAEQARTLFQSERASADAFVGDLTGDHNALREAEASGGDIVIPLSTFVAKVAPLPNAAEIARHVRLSADHLSRAELEDEGKLDEHLAALFGDTTDAAERAAPETAQADTSDKVTQDVLGMLLATDRYSPADAELQAKLVGRVFGRMAERTGQDAFDLYSRYQLRINGRGGRQGAPNTLDPRTDAVLTAARTGAIPDGRDLFGPSLVSALVAQGGVQDPGGDLRSFDALKQRPGLISQHGMPLDAAREWAVEAGYLRDHGAEQGAASSSDINDLLDAIDSELRGNPTFSEQNADPKAQAFANEARDLQRAIDEHPALRDMPAADVQALSNQELHDLLFAPDAEPSLLQKAVGKVKALFQPAFHGSPHRGIERFSLQKIGTGEGNQAFGWGLYFASERAIAEQYRTVLAQHHNRHRGDPAHLAAAQSFREHGSSETEAMGSLRKAYPNASAGELQEALREAYHGDGQLYGVDVPEDHDLLDWDKPLSEQPENVKDALERAGVYPHWREQEALRKRIDAVDTSTDAGVAEWRQLSDEMAQLRGDRGIGPTATGRSAYVAIGYSKRDQAIIDGRNQDTTQDAMQRAASEALNAAGIPGLRYLDGSSRGKGEGSHNYVIWDEGAVGEPRTFYQSAVPPEDEIARLRAKVAELEKELRTDALTGLRNKRAFDEDAALGWPTVAAMDMDGLKRLNDAIGHQAADEVLRVLGGVLLASETEVVRFYRHTGGDEFAARFQNPDDAERIMAALQQRLESVAIDLDVADDAGKVRHLTYEGIGLSYGTGTDYERADAAASVNKRDRLAAGIREEARADGQPRRLQPRGSAGRDGGQGHGPEPNAAGQVNDETPPTGGVSASGILGGMTETPAFRQWFGDSKVVDADGKPLVVYRGGKARTTFRDGGFFAYDRSLAEDYAGDVRGGSVGAFYLSLHTPLILSTGEAVREAWEASGALGSDGFHGSDSSAQAKLRRWATAQGYDGIMVEPSAFEGDVGYEWAGGTFGEPQLVAFRPEQIKSATANNGNFDPADPSILHQPDGAGAPRGRLQIGANRAMRVDLFRGADLSTFLHESGHFFLEVMQDAAAASTEVAADLERVRAWVGNDGGAFTEDQHEQFARGFEAYLREGRAPAPELRGMFGRFRAWLSSVYRDLRQLNVTLTDEVRGVFDRMLATDAEVEAAQAKQGVQPITLADEARGLLKPGQWEAYLAATQDATDEARAEVLQKLLAAHAREAKAWWREQQAAVRAEVEAEFEAVPAVRAWRILAGRQVVDKATPPPANGMVRLYHGGVDGQSANHSRWFTASLSRAQAYADKGVKGSQVYYVDLPADHPLVEPEYEGQGILNGADWVGELPFEIAKQRRPFVEADSPIAGMRLDRQALIDAYGDAWVKDKMLKLGVYRKEGGVHPDTAAAALGFPSGDALVKALAEVRDLQARVAQEVDDRMHARHPDPALDGSLPDLAMRAVHNNARVKALEAEQAILATLANQPVPPARLVREYARRKIADLTVRAVRPNDYLAAERRAAAAVAKAAAQGDYAEALQHKRAQALQAALYREARDAQDRAEAQVAALRKLAGDKARDRIGKAGKDYLDALDELLEGHELRPVSGAEVRRRAALRAWVESQQSEDELGVTNVDEALLARVESERVTNVLDLTVQQLADLHAAAQNIAHLARLKNKLLKGKDARDWDEAKGELLDRMRAVLDQGKPPPLSTADLSLLERMGQGYTGFMDWMLRPETVVEWLDGGESGPWHDYFWQQMEAGEAERNRLRRMVAEPLVKMMAELPAAERRGLDSVVHIDSLGRSMSRGTILSVLLNLGNASNRDKLMRGGMMIDGEVVPFEAQDIGAMLGELTAAQAQLAQKIWDAIEGLWPEIVRQQEKLAGYAPEKIEATPVTFTTKDGQQVTLAGGYYPAAYDPRAGQGGARQAADADKLLDGSFTPAFTSKGHTKERNGYAAPMLLDYQAVLSRHLNNVITDLAYRQPLRQMLRILGDSTIKGVIHQRLSRGAYHALLGSVKATIQGTNGISEPSAEFFEKVKGGVIRNTVVAALGLKVGLLVANTLTAPILALARVKTRYVAEGLGRYYRHPAKLTAMIHELSPFMLDRAENAAAGYEDVLAELRGKHGIRARIAEASLALHHTINPLVERGLWLGRYMQAQAEGADISEAVRLADKAIRQTQTQAAPKDLAAVERDPKYKLFNLFLGPMVIANNRLQEAGLRGKLRGAVETPAQALGVWFAMVVANGALFELLSGRGPDDDDDDGLDWKDWSVWLAKKAALFPFQTMPFVRNAANAIDQVLEGQNASARPDPLTEAMGIMVKFGKSAGEHGLDAWQGDEAAQARIAKDTTRAAGVAVGLPTQQLLTTGSYLYDLSTGQAQLQSPLDARYLVYKRPAK